MIKNLSIKVEVSPGSSIETACKEAVELATRLDMNIWFDFNSVSCLARPMDLWERIVSSWHTEIKSDKQYKIATSN